MMMTERRTRILMNDGEILLLLNFFMFIPLFTDSARSASPI